MRLDGEGRGLTWCAQWWAHAPVAVRLHALWQAWETARHHKDPGAMAGWWVRLAEPMLRVICSGETGPMRLCSVREHYPVESLRVVPAPVGWFSLDDEGGGPRFVSHRDTN